MNSCMKTYDFKCTKKFSVEKFISINSFVNSYVKTKFISYQYINSHMKWCMNSYVINSYLNTQKYKFIYKFIFEKTQYGFMYELIYI